MTARNKAAYLKGRWEIGGERLRSDACSAIPMAALQVLREYRQDVDSQYFWADHDDEEKFLVEALIAWGEGIIDGAYLDLQRKSLDRSVYLDDVTSWQSWMRAVAGLLPRLWD